MGENKRYYWLKLKKDFFNSKEMKKLRKLAGGDTFTIIYLKMQLLSLDDEGKLYFDGVEDSFAEEIALQIDEDPENVKVTILYLQKVGLIEMQADNELFLSEVPYMTGSETDKAEYMRKKRQQKSKCVISKGNNVTQMLPDVTKCYTEIEKEIEIDILLTQREVAVSLLLKSLIFFILFVNHTRKSEAFQKTGKKQFRHD